MNLTYEQTRISLLQLYNSDKPIYNLYFYLNVNGNIDWSIFEKSVNFIILKYKNLQTNIVLVDDKLKKKYNRKKIKIINTNSMNLMENLEKPFDITKDLLLKIFFIQEESKIFFLFHDLVIDGMTCINFFLELESYYNSFISKKLPVIRKIIHNDTNYLSKINFWKKYICKTNLSNNIKVKSNIIKNDENRYEFIFSNTYYTNIMNIIKNLEVTLFDYFYGIFNIILKNMTSNKEIYIDSLVAVKTDDIGLYNKVILLKTEFNDKITLKQFLKNNSINEVKNKVIPLELVCKECNLSHLPLIRLHFEYSGSNIPNQINFSDAILTSDFTENNSKYIRQLLTLNVCLTGNSIKCYFSFRDNCFDIEYIKILVDEFKKIIDCNLNTKLSSLGNNTIRNYYTIPFYQKLDSRSLAYSLAGKYQDITFSEFKNALDKCKNR